MENKNAPLLELIETLWNVNLCGKKLALRKESELIETLWNVNEDNSTPVSDFHTELIETLWNVNMFTLTGQDRHGIGINRNIVECKL